MNFTDEVFNNAVSLFLKTIRIKNGITESELAILLNVSQQQVSRYENGKTKLTIERVNQYLEIFGLNWDSFANEIIKNIKNIKNIKKG